MRTRRQAALPLVICVIATLAMLPPASANGVRKVGLLAGPLTWNLTKAVPMHLALIRGLELDMQAYHESGGLRYLRRSSVDPDSDLATLAGELVAEGVDVLVTDSAAAARAAASATPRVPIVAILEHDPVASGLAESLARPGGNVTGVVLRQADVISEQLELLRALVPGLRRLAVVYNPVDPGAAEGYRLARDVATRFEVALEPVEIGLMSEVEPALEAALPSGCQALLVLDDNAAFTHQHAINEFAQRHRLPAMYPFDGYVAKKGKGLIAYGPDRWEIKKHLAVLVDRVLGGASPATLPMTQASSFRLVVRRDVAQSIGIEIPTSILIWADRVID